MATSLRRDRAKRNPTIKTVADYAGVSTGTVSKVINKSENVQAKTRQKVVDAIKALKYRPHAGGRFLKSRASWLVGLLVVEDTDSFLLDPFIGQIAAGLCNRLGIANRKLVLFGARPFTVAEALPFHDVSIDALVCLYPGDEKACAAIREMVRSLNLPSVLLQERPIAQSDDWCVIDLDQDQAATLIWSRIRLYRPQRLVFLEPEMKWSAIERRHAKVAELAASSPETPTVIHLQCAQGGFSDAYRALNASGELLAPRTAFVASNDRMALAALRCIQERGLSTTADVAIMGFHDFEFRSAVRPLLTSIRSGAYRLGETAAESLLQRLEAGRFSRKLVKLGVEIAEGETA